MNWGYRITIAFILFAAFIGYIVIRASTTKNELVDSNYYEQEMKYQNVMNEKQNTANLNQKPVINQQGENIVISFPDELAKNFESGECLFFRPADSKLDKTIKLNLENGNQNLATSQFSKGLYSVKLSWQMNGKKYVDEKDLVIQ
jgi:nitrogen fixation protein FixH